MEKPNVARGAVERTFGRYQLLEPIAKGGMAEVWRGKLIGAEQFERPMVIKRILPHLCEDPEFVRMFVTEARLSARLHHPNIVQVFELGDVDGELFMAIEQVEGVELLALLRKYKKPLPPGLCAKVAHDLCRALAYAYGVTDEDGVPLGIVHRDVSPSNVMLSYDGQVRLLDFGIAKALNRNADRSHTGNLKGKLGYLAPEVLDGAQFDHRADLFAVGVVLWEMLTGRRLFRGSDDIQIMAEARACRVQPPSLMAKGVPPALERVALRALERDPELRYQHASELLAELQPLLFDLRWGADETAAFLREAMPPEQEVEMPRTGTASAPALRPQDLGSLRPLTMVPMGEAPTTMSPLPRRAPTAAPVAAWWRSLWPLALGLAALLLGASVWLARRHAAVRPPEPALVDAPEATPPAASVAAEPPPAAPVAAAPPVAPVAVEPSPVAAEPPPAAPVAAAPPPVAVPAAEVAHLPAPRAAPPAEADRAETPKPSRRPSPARHPDGKRRRPSLNLERGDVLDSLQ